MNVQYFVFVYKARFQNSVIEADMALELLQISGKLRTTVLLID